MTGCGSGDGDWPGGQALNLAAATLWARQARRGQPARRGNDRQTGVAGIR